MHLPPGRRSKPNPSCELWQRTPFRSRLKTGGRLPLSQLGREGMPPGVLGNHMFWFGRYIILVMKCFEITIFGDVCQKRCCSKKNQVCRGSQFSFFGVGFGFPNIWEKIHNLTICICSQTKLEQKQQLDLCRSLFRVVECYVLKFGGKQFTCFTVYLLIVFIFLPNSRLLSQHHSHFGC